MTDTTAPRPNRDLRDEIRDSWSDRAATFDRDPGHKIAEGSERAAWAALEADIAAECFAPGNAADAFNDSCKHYCV